MNIDVSILIKFPSFTSSQNHIKTIMYDAKVNLKLEMKIWTLVISVIMIDHMKRIKDGYLTTLLINTENVFNNAQYLFQI